MKAVILYISFISITFGISRKDFGNLVKQSLMEVNKAQQISDKLATNLATGKSENIHETMLALSKAELSFNLVVQVNGKVRDTILVSAEITEDTAKQAAMSSNKIELHIQGKEVKKTIYVPGKLINIVAI